MIVIAVKSFHGQPADGPAASFDELGGTIGRADTNQLVLPDPDRSISRVHAQVVFRHGAYALIDRGSNAVLINGQPLGNGREAPIRDGDTITLGAYALGVSYGQSARPRDPFADLFGPDAAGPGMASAPGMTTPAPAFPAAPAAQALPPVAAPAFNPPAAPTPPQGNAAAHLFGGAPLAGMPSAPNLAPASRPPAASPPPGIPSLPDDWDIFAPPPASPATGNSPQIGAPGDAMAPGLPLSSPSNSDSLDALFGLGGPGGSGSADPFAQSPLAAPLMQPNTSADADPLRALGLAAAPVAAPLPDHLSDLHAPWQAPALRPAGGAAPAARPMPFTDGASLAAHAPAPTPSASPAPPPGAVLSWHQPSRDGKVVTLPGAPRATPVLASPPPAASQAPPAFMPDNPPSQVAAAWADDAAEPGPLTRIIPRAKPAHPFSAAPGDGPSVQAAPVPFGATPQPPSSAAIGQAFQAPPAAPAQAMPHAAAPAGQATTAEAWLPALAAGLGLPPERLQALDVQQVQLLGQLLREATRGTVELLLARAALKREMRTDVTMIVARENNPLKFSPTVEVALQHLLGAPTPGFMPPAQAMRDAFDDLRAHQMAVMAGMHAALAGVLKRFEPALLESQITARRGGLASLLPSGRKAQLWEQFQQLYTQLSAEAADDFQQLFGKAFRQAYEAHIDQLQQPGD